MDQYLKWAWMAFFSILAWSPATSLLCTLLHLRMQGPLSWIGRWISCSEIQPCSPASKWVPGLYRTHLSYTQTCLKVFLQLHVIQIISKLVIPRMSLICQQFVVTLQAQFGMAPLATMTNLHIDGTMETNIGMAMYVQNSRTDLQTVHDLEGAIVSSHGHTISRACTYV